MKSDLSFYRKRAVVLLYVEERKVFLYHLGKPMRKDKKGGAAVCKITCHYLFSAGCYTCEAKTVYHPLRRGVKGSCYLQ